MERVDRRRVVVGAMTVSTLMSEARDCLRLRALGIIVETDPVLLGRGPFASAGD